MSRRRRLIPLAVVAVTVSACSGSEATSPSTRPSFGGITTTTRADDEFDIVVTTAIDREEDNSVEDRSSATISSQVAVVVTEPNLDGIMPDVLCMDLQDAQNLIQTRGVFFSRSEDASGDGRRQIIDSNWIVIGQTPAAGEPIGEGDAVLSVLKDAEVTECTPGVGGS